MRTALPILPLFAALAGCASVEPSRTADVHPTYEEQVIGVDGVAVTALEPGLTPPKRDRTGGRYPARFFQRAHARVEATVTVEGRATDVRVVETDDPLFAEAFARSIETSRFEPARRAGSPVAVRMAFFEERVPVVPESEIRFEEPPNYQDLFGPPARH